MICPQVQTNQNSNLAGWILLGLLVGILLTDYWLYKSGRPTISRWIRHKTDKHYRWIKPLGIGLLGLLLYHLFFGGPL